MDPSRLLYAVGQALSARALYADGHPARERTATVSFERFLEVQRAVAKPAFSFLDGNVLLGAQPIRELRGWEWGQRFDDAGMQRWEFADDVPRYEWDAFLNTLHLRLTMGIVNTEEDVRESAHPSIRFGVIGVKGEGGQFIKDDLPVATLSISLREERDAMDFIVEGVERVGEVQAAEAEAVVASLAVAMHGDSEIALPLIQLKEYDQYTAAHSINVSVLVMALAEFLGLSPRDVRAIGVAGLMHDLGMAKVPKAILAKSGPLTPEEWHVIRQHPVYGAQMILQSEPQLDLAAVVAFEHHMLPNGGGYPKVHYAREPHFASQLVQICAVYDALRTRRFHRDATPPELAIEHIEERAGTTYPSEIALAFAKMMRQWERRIVRADDTPIVRATPHGSVRAVVPGATGVMNPAAGVMAGSATTSTGS